MWSQSLFECKLVCLVDIGRIYSLVTQNLQLDWSIPITWERNAAGKQFFFTKHRYFLVQQPKAWQIFQMLSLLIPLEQVVYFRKTDYKQPFVVLRIDVLENSLGNTCVGVSFYSVCSALSFHNEALTQVLSCEFCQIFTYEIRNCLTSPI